MIIVTNLVYLCQSVIIFPPMSDLYVTKLFSLELNKMSNAYNLKVLPCVRNFSVWVGLRKIYDCHYFMSLYGCTG